MLIQQGDVLLESYDGEIEGKKLDHLILAHGESGHRHEVETRSDLDKEFAELYESKKGLVLKVIGDEVEVRHEEHKTVTLPKGNYTVRRVQEYDHFLEESRNVQD